MTITLTKEDIIRLVEHYVEVELDLDSPTILNDHNLLKVENEGLIIIFEK